MPMSEGGRKILQWRDVHLNQERCIFLNTWNRAIWWSYWMILRNSLRLCPARTQETLSTLDVETLTSSLGNSSTKDISTIWCYFQEYNSRNLWLWVFWKVMEMERKGWFHLWKPNIKIILHDKLPTEEKWN